MSSIGGLVDEYGPKGQWRELGAVLDRMDRRRLAAGEQEMRYRAMGIVEFRTNRRARGGEIFEEGVRSFPTSGGLNYGLGQEYEGQGRIDEMAACFRHVRLEQVGSPTVLAMARYYYLWNRFELGQIVIQPIFDRYYQLKGADDMFLYMRGLPMFDESFGYRATFARMAGKLDHARLELARARSELSDLDVDHHELDLEATKTGKWEPVLADLESRLKALDAGTPTGPLRTKRDVFRCRAEGTVGAALAELAAVHVTRDEPAGLADIPTLARAEQFRRFQLPDREQAALAEFWPRQALLLEPNHAFTFGFLDYQEALEPP